MNKIVKQIDDLFGSGYAKKHPNLIGQYLIAKAISDIDETLSSTFQCLIDSLDKTETIFKFLGLRNERS